MRGKIDLEDRPLSGCLFDDGLAGSRQFGRILGEGNNDDDVTGNVL